MRRIVVIAVILLIAATACAQNQSKKETAAGVLLFENAVMPMPAGPGKVAFFRSDVKIPGDPIELYVGDVKTGEETRALPGHNFRQDAGLAAAWSPDGSEFVIPGKLEGNWELFLFENGSRSGKPISSLAKYRVDVTQQQKVDMGITEDMQLSLSQLRFSPDGSRLMFSMNRLAKSALWWMDMKTGNVRQATEERKGYVGAFFPDDDRFCYVEMVRKGGDISSDEDIILRSIKSGILDTLISTREHEFDPDVSPDGNYLAFVKRHKGTNNVYVMKLSTREIRQITHAHAGQGCTLPRWNHAGDTLYLQATGFTPKASVFGMKFEAF
jgi:Tol biopolymer transport system component